MVCDVQTKFAEASCALGRVAPPASRRPCLPFDCAVPPGGYAWWYFDGESDCGSYGICIIGFVGSVFSPHYARAQRRGQASADDHVALNVVLYGRRRGWVFTEQHAAPGDRTATHFTLRASALRATADGFVIDVDERQTPTLARLVGRIRFTVAGPGGEPHHLDAGGAHRWWPVAPLCRVAVDLKQPQLTWVGRGYHDANWGEAPLQTAFASWSWLRALHPEGTLVHYAPTPAPGCQAAAPWAMLYRYDGRQIAMPLPAPRDLPRSRWGLRPVCHGAGAVLDQLEDTPFYTRARLALPLDGKMLVAMHEYLDLTRWQAPWVQFLLPFRLRRRRAPR
jgi:carotenoid 1,2-hydratase